MRGEHFPAGPRQDTLLLNRTTGWFVTLADFDRTWNFVMTKTMQAAALFLAAVALSIEPALAHHVMGGRMPATFADGLLSGLGHPIIGLDHFAALIAVACLASVHRAGALLVVGFVLAMITGVAVHVRGATVPGAEIMVALSVIALGAALLRDRSLNTGAALGLFAAVGLIHGYALGESIYGAESSPLAAYFIGLAAVQAAVALGAMLAARAVLQRPPGVLALRLVGAGIAGIGLAILMQHLVPGA
jgi:urease accessory protein